MHERTEYDGDFVSSLSESLSDSCYHAYLSLLDTSVPCFVSGHHLDDVAEDNASVTQERGRERGKRRK